MVAYRPAGKRDVRRSPGRVRNGQLRNNRLPAMIEAAIGMLDDRRGCRLLAAVSEFPVVFLNSSNGRAR